ncbi:protein Abitram [Sitodiplosis mosellana]|uniref:protein Abitram n=1 Tax=Sitodiplosis mosellana TaxID=263140 RepID=UPI002445252C|nr:protein Abitram [Sitodiplosis mosellana]
MADINLEQYYFNPDSEVICGDMVPPINDSHNFDYDNYPSVVERYYTKYYYFRNGDINEAHTLLNHSNSICLVGLADTHIAVKKGIKSMTFDVGNFDRSKNQVTGKGKKGAMNLQVTSCLAIVTCDDDSTYRISSTIQGKLIEVNERLLSNPKLIGQDGHGYIAIVLPKLDKCKEQLEKLVTEEEYQAQLKQQIDENGVEIKSVV